MMRWENGTRGGLTHLGSLRGTGAIRTAIGPSTAVAYELDGYRERTKISASGRMTGDAQALDRAFRAGEAELALAGEKSIRVALYDPRGGAAAEFVVSGAMPAFPRS